MKNYDALRNEKENKTYFAIPTGGSLYMGFDMLCLERDFKYNEFIQAYIPKEIYDDYYYDKEEFIDWYYGKIIDYKTDDDFNFILDSKGHRIKNDRKTKQKIRKELIEKVFD